VTVVAPKAADPAKPNKAIRNRGPKLLWRTRPPLSFSASRMPNPG
jgi:hypothetical protein